MIVLKLPAALSLLSVHHGPLAFAGFAFVVFLFFAFYIRFLDKPLAKINRFLRILIQIIYLVIAMVALYLLMLGKEDTSEESDIKDVTLHFPERDVDTTIIKTWDMEHFDFQVIHVGNYYPPEESYAILQFHNSDVEIKLLDCHPATTDMGAEPEKLYDNIYSFPYYTGGNYSRSSGIELFRVARDSIKYIGPVCGYEDMNDDGEKEFYVYKVAQFGRGQAYDIYDTITVELIDDSLDYPFFDRSY